MTLFTENDGTRLAFDVEELFSLTISDAEVCGLFYRLQLTMSLILLNLNWNVIQKGWLNFPLIIVNL